MAVQTINLSDPVSTWVTKTNVIATNQGDLASLPNAESSLVAAILNLDSDVTAIQGGSGTSLSTLDSDLGTRTSLNTTDKSSLVAAINEIYSLVDSDLNEASEIRGLFSASSGVAYDDSSGEFTASGIVSSNFSSAATLLIKDSDGTTLKTIYSPGS